MSANQEIYEMSMRYKDPDKYKEHMKAKVAFEDGDDNAVEGDGSYQGRTTSGGVGGREIKTYGMKPKQEESNTEPTPAPIPEAPQAEKKPSTPVQLSPEIQQAKERVNSYQDYMDGSAGSAFDSNDVDYNSLNEAEDTNETAAASFLDSKKASLKDKMTFTPAI